MNGALAFRVGDNFEMNFDALYSKFTIDEDQNQAWYSRNGVMGNWDDSTSWCYGRPGHRATTRWAARSSGATLDNCYASVTNVIAQYTEDKDLLVTGANIKIEATWTMNADLSYSKAKRKNRWAAFRSETYPATMTWDMSGGVTPSLSTSSNPADVNGQSAPSWLTGTADGPDDLKDSLTALKVDFERQFDGDHLKAIKFGARVSNRKKDYLHRHQDYTPIFTGTLPATLFTNYSVTEFDAPPLLNGNYNEIVDFVYGGMPVDDNAIVQSSHLGRR